MAEEDRTATRVVKARVAIGGESLDDLPPEERAIAERVGLGPHRRAEYRAGRMAARQALALLGFPDAVIGREDDGAPVALGLDGVAVSITHGRRWAVGAAARVPRLGVDLCELARGPNVQRVSARFLDAAEGALAVTAADWATLWALKESAAKALRRGLFDGGLAGSRVASLAPPAFAWPAFAATVELGEEDVVATTWLAAAAGGGAGNSG